MKNKYNYKLSWSDTIKNIIDCAEHSYMNKCKARGCNKPIPFAVMMKGYVCGLVLIGIAIVIVVMK